MNGIEDNKIAIFQKNNLIPILNSKKEIKKIKKRKIKFGIHVDTGINRLGIENFKLIKNILLYKNLVIELLLCFVLGRDRKLEKVLKH